MTPLDQPAISQVNVEPSIETTVHAHLCSFLTNAICTIQQQFMHSDKVEYTCLRSTNYSEQFMHTHTTHIILQRGRFTHCVHTNQSIIIHWLCANELATMCNCLRQCAIALCEYSVPNANVNTTQNLQSSYMHTIHTYMCHIACVRCLCANVNQSLYNDVASCDKE